MKYKSKAQPILADISSFERKFPSKKSALALAISASIMAGIAPSYAADEQDVELDKVVVQDKLSGETNPYAETGVPYKAKYSSDERRTRPIAETPQTFNVLTSTEIEESGRSDLREILDGVPGITIGTGENGNAFGDRYIIRGHEARSDVFVDGLHDPGMTIRESFAVEQVEVSKGPSSTFAGRGTTGGSVNSATKQASTEYDFTNLSLGFGTDEYHRYTIDANKSISDDTALRLNLLGAYEVVPDRAPADRDRNGVAFSLFHQPTDKLEITTDYYHLDAEDKPDLGTYVERFGSGPTATFGDPVDDIPVYLQDEDFLESTVDTFTLRIGYEASPTVRVTNLARYGTTENGYLVTGTRQASTAFETEADAVANTNPFTTVTLSTHQGWQEVNYFADQLNFLVDTEMLGMLHEWIFTAEYSDQRVLNGLYTNSITSGNCYTRTGAGAAVSAGCIYDSNGNEVSGLNGVLDRDISKGRWDQDWHVKTVSLSAMDTVDLTDNLTLFAGLRMDRYDLNLKMQDNSFVVTEHKESDTLMNYHLGLTYKVAQDGIVYASYSTATNINGGESDVGTSSGYGGFIPNVNADPEQTVSIELGTKWNLLNDRLLATAAIFQITKDDVMEGNGYEETGTANSGKNEVKGVEFGLVGNVTDKFSLSAGVALMESEVLESATPDNVGKPLANFADKSASLHGRYQATPKFAVGGGAKYESERFLGQPDTAANEDLGIPAYTMYDAFASYRVERNLDVRVNVNNLTDKDYYLAGYRSGAFVYKGDGRSVTLTVDYDF